MIKELVEGSIIHWGKSMNDKMAIDKMAIKAILAGLQTLFLTPMSVTTLTRSLPQRISDAAFRFLNPDIIRVSTVKVGPYSHLISPDPLTAGSDFASLLQRMGDIAPLASEEKAYLPWMVELRKMVWGLGAWKMEIESPLGSKGPIPHGICDLLVYGGPQHRGVIEVKVVTRGSVNIPRGRDLSQVGAYARLVAGNGSFDRVFAAVAYVELETPAVRLFGVSNARELVTTTLELFKAA